MKDKHKSTDIPGNVSCSCNYGALGHCCHTTHTLTISAQVIHLQRNQMNMSTHDSHYMYSITNQISILPVGHLSQNV